MRITVEYGLVPLFAYVAFAPTGMRRAFGLGEEFVVMQVCIEQDSCIADDDGDGCHVTHSRSLACSKIIHYNVDNDAS